MRHMLIDLDLEFTKNNRFLSYVFFIKYYKYNIRETTNIEINILIQGTNNAANFTFTFCLIILLPFLYYAN